MKNFYLSLSLALTLILSACLSTNSTAIFKPGTTFEQKQRDMDRCKIESFKTIPQILQTHMDGGYYHSGRLKCHTDDKGHTSCKQIGEYYRPPTATTFDRNDTLRWRFVQTCLQNKGYGIVSNLRRCSNETERLRAMQAVNLSDLVCNPQPDLDY